LRIDSVAVLPVAFAESPNGAQLVRAYDAVRRGRDEGELSRALVALLEVLAPQLVVAHNWSLAEGPPFAHGMDLRDR
jgi:hypothetical protein